MKLSSITNKYKVLTTHKIIDSDYIKKTLDIYKPEHIYLKSAVFMGTEIIGLFDLQHYPFTKDKHIDYVTASMLMLYLSQLGYVLVRLLSEDQSSPYNLKISTDEFFHLRDQGNLMFTRFDQVKFRRKISISESPLKIKVAIKSVVQRRAVIIGDIAFSVGPDFFSGNARVVIVLNKEIQDE